MVIDIMAGTLTRLPAFKAILLKHLVQFTLAVLPAISVAVPVTDWSVPSVLITVSGVIVSIPDSSSVAVKFTVTSVLYHPLALGWVVAAPVITGGVLSILMSLSFVGSTYPPPPVVR